MVDWSGVPSFITLSREDAQQVAKSINLGTNNKYIKNCLSQAEQLASIEPPMVVKKLYGGLVFTAFEWLRNKIETDHDGKILSKQDLNKYAEDVWSRMASEFKIDINDIPANDMGLLKSFFNEALADICSDVLKAQKSTGKK